MQLTLFPVKITKQDTCWTYACKRLNHIPKCEWLSALDENYKLQKFNLELINVGDIVVWNARRKTILLPMEIDENGLILTVPIEDEIHTGIVEQVLIENNIVQRLLISDVTKSTNINSIPIIRIRNLFSEGQRQPDYFIKSPEH